MKSVTIHAFDKDSNKSMSGSIFLDTKENMESQKKDFFDSVPFRKYFTEIESHDDFDEDEMNLLEELDLSPEEDF